MKRAIILAALVAMPALAQAGHQVQGYYRSNGTYVAPHYQSNPNSTKLDNYGTQGNVNPSTGQQGTVNPYAQTQSNPYGTPNNAPRAINPYTGRPY